MAVSILNQSEALRHAILDVAEVAQYIWQKGWGERNGGNITLNVTDYMSNLAYAPMDVPVVSLPIALPHIAGRFFYVKGTQRRMRDLARMPMDNGCIIRMNDEGTAYQYIADQVIAPTSELPSHLMVQDYLSKSGSAYRATLHTHPLELVALSHLPEFLDDSERPNHLTRTLWSMIPETLAFAPLGLGIVPYEVPGSLELANATLQQIHDYDVTLWEKHGVFAVGTDIMDAFDQVDVLNKAARIYLDACATGQRPTGMTMQQMQQVQTIFSLPTKRIV